MKIKKIDKIDTHFVKFPNGVKSNAVALCTQEAYNDIREMLMSSDLKNSKFNATLNYDDDGNWRIYYSMEFKLRKPKLRKTK